MFGELEITNDNICKNFVNFLSTEKLKSLYIIIHINILNTGEKRFVV